MNAVFDARLTDINLNWGNNAPMTQITPKIIDTSDSVDMSWSRCYTSNQKFTTSIFTLTLLLCIHLVFFKLYAPWILISINISLVNPVIVALVSNEANQHIHIILIHFCAFANFLAYTQHNTNCEFLYFAVASVICVHLTSARTYQKLPSSSMLYAACIINICLAVYLGATMNHVHSSLFDIAMICLWFMNVWAYCLVKTKVDAQNLSK